MNERYLIHNTEERIVFEELNQSLRECSIFYFNVAFMNYGGLQLFLNTLDECRMKGTKGNILTSTYLNFSDPKAFRKLQEFDNIELKVYDATKNNKGFHSKAYIFEYEEHYKIIIGSSNMTQSALKSNIEWNVCLVQKKKDHFAVEIMNTFMKLWNSVEEITEDFIIRYEILLEQLLELKKKEIEIQNSQLILPNKMQTRAIENLRMIREQKEKKALVIAATGTGKTYMSAFDILETKPKKVLFLVHREDILRSAMKAYKNVLGDINTGLFTGTSKEYHQDYIFSTIQTMRSNLELFKKDEFDYIVVDEAHHITSPTYKKILDYFTPEFLLGMTATPERSDGEDILELFDQNIAIEIRLHEAMEEELVVPFHYFGIKDITNYQDLDANEIKKLVKALNVNERVDYIFEKMKFYGHDGKKRKGLGFCASIEHAIYMNEEFNKKGIPSRVLTGSNTVNERKEVMKYLEDEEHELEMIFTVDVFNEGIDIPSINLVLMLRPTESPIIFVQQLGRGLRKYEGKEYLTVLDFIGNHSRAFMIALALKGNTFYDQNSLMTSVQNNFNEIPGSTYIQMDQFTKEEVLRQLSTENFNSKKYMNEEYKAFKRLYGKVPYELMSYHLFDNAPDPLKFMKGISTYLDFLKSYDTEVVVDPCLEEKEFVKAYKCLKDLLPLKRIHEFVIVKEVLLKGALHRKELKKEIEYYIENTTASTLEHAIQVLQFVYYDVIQVEKWNSIVKENGTFVEGNLLLEKFRNNEKQRRVLLDLLNYGIQRYRNEFGVEDCGFPFLKKYQTYTMQDVALVCNLDKKLSSFRGAGLVKHNNDYFLFINLHKEEVKESINYKDEFINTTELQWETPNNTRQDSELGKNIIFNKEREINLHIFVRKYKKIGTVVQPFIYIGKGNSTSHNGNAPITVRILLQEELPYHLYLEFKKDVKH